MPSFKNKFQPFVLCAFVLIAIVAWQQRKAFEIPSEAKPGSRELSSNGEYFESAETCAPERSYLIGPLAQLANAYKNTRVYQAGFDMPRACVTYIMQNFINATTAPSDQYAQCAGPISRPTRGAYMPCITEEYSNSIYNSLMDVADCMSIPVKELMPKLFNESGLHLNILGGGFDAGVGQLTAPAIQEIFMRFDDVEGNPSTLDYYVKQMGHSKKSSCQRIMAETSAYKIQPPRGKKVCMIHEAKADAARPEAERICFKPWVSDNRCVVMAAPNNPLRNILFTAIFYKAMVRTATGVKYSGGQDVIWNNSREEKYVGQIPFKGVIGNKNFTQRMKNLGAFGADENVIKQIIVSLGFNAGIDTGKILLDNFLKQREVHQLLLSDGEIDFQNTATGKWAIVTNPYTYFKGLSTLDQGQVTAALAAFDVLTGFRVNIKKIKADYLSQRIEVQAALDILNGKNLTLDQMTAQLNILRAQYFLRFKPNLDKIINDAYKLSLPEYMRIAHAQFGKGGAPGYLGFLASKYKQLEKEMGNEVCTPAKYLQF